MSRFPSKIAVNVVFHQDVVQAMNAEIAAHPHVEVGGKLVGHVQNGRSPNPELDPAEQVRNTDFLVLGYLDAGPRAQRTPTFHLPDGLYQEALFRHLEAHDPNIEHLGTWHSHHPNGLSSLSSGDVRGYFLDVTNRNYNLDFYLATLAVDASGFDHAKHHLFVRGWRDFAVINPLSVSVIDGSNPLTALLEQGKTAVLNAAPPKVINWYETAEGENTLKEDQLWARQLLETVTLRQNRISGNLSWVGFKSQDDMTFKVRYEYLKVLSMIRPRLEVSASNYKLSFELNEGDQQHRDDILDRLILMLSDLSQEAEGGGQ